MERAGREVATAPGVLVSTDPFDPGVLVRSAAAPLEWQKMPRLCPP